MKTPSLLFCLLATAVLLLAHDSRTGADAQAVSSLFGPSPAAPLSFFAGSSEIPSPGGSSSSPSSPRSSPESSSSSSSSDSSSHSHSYVTSSPGTIGVVLIICGVALFMIVVIGIGVLVIGASAKKGDYLSRVFGRRSSNSMSPYALASTSGY